MPGRAEPATTGGRRRGARSLPADGGPYADRPLTTMKSDPPPPMPEPSQGALAGAVPAIIGSGTDRGVATLDGWVVPPHTADRRKRGRGSDGRTETMTHPLADLVEQFCAYQRKQRGRTEGGVKTYRWNLEQFLTFVRARDGRLARLRDLRVPVIQAWMDEMAASDLGP